MPQIVSERKESLVGFFFCNVFFKLQGSLLPIERELVLSMPTNHAVTVNFPVKFIIKKQYDNISTR